MKKIRPVHLTIITVISIFLAALNPLRSVGIMKTGLVHKYVERLFRRNSGSILKLLLLPYLFGIVLIFLIPQAFAGDCWAYFRTFSHQLHTIMLEILRKKCY